MSNCVFGRAGLPLVRDASRLALHAPALCAATTLSRYARRAVGLSGGRHSAPTVTTVVPQHVIASHGIERGEDFSHHCDDGRPGKRSRSASLRAIPTGNWSRPKPGNDRGLLGASSIQTRGCMNSWGDRNGMPVSGGPFPFYNCIARMQWRPEPMHGAQVAAATNVLFD